MFNVRNAGLEDVSGAVGVLGEAFARDPLMLHLFGDNPTGLRAGTMEFFSMLLRARIALGMPASVLEDDGRMLGVMMGYDTTRPVWPEAITTQWRHFESRVPHFAERLAAYDALCVEHQPGEDHHYLGVIGVHPMAQGRGVGKAMLDAFCGLSRDDPKSDGVYLDTANPDSLQFYYRNGFELRGEGRLGATPLWCVYKRT